MNLPGGQIINVADEAQCQMVIFGIDPARAEEPAPQQGKVLCEIGRDFETREQTGHISLLDRFGTPKSDREPGVEPKARSAQLIPKIRLKGNSCGSGRTAYSLLRSAFAPN